MMTRADIAVKAYTIARDRGATTVDTIHVLIAVMRMHDNLTSDFMLMEQVLAFVTPARKNKTQPIFSDAAQFALDQLTTTDATMAWLQQSYQTLVSGASIDVTAPPVLPPTPPAPRRSVAENFADLDASDWVVLRQARRARNRGSPTGYGATSRPRHPCGF
jgi:hypothetical protein